MSNQQEEKELSPEQQEALKTKMMEEWDAMIPFLEKKKHYEGLITELHELEMRRTYAMRKLAEMTASNPPQAKNPSESGQSNMRALKKEPQ